MLFGWFLTN